MGGGNPTFGPLAKFRQARRVQVPVSERVCGFESHRGHADRHDGLEVLLFIPGGRREFSKARFGARRLDLPTEGRLTVPLMVSAAAS